MSESADIVDRLNSVAPLFKAIEKVGGGVQSLTGLSQLGLEAVAKGVVDQSMMDVHIFNVPRLQFPIWRIVLAQARFGIVNPVFLSNEVAFEFERAFYATPLEFEVRLIPISAQTNTHQVINMISGRGYAPTNLAELMSFRIAYFDRTHGKRIVGLGSTIKKENKDCVPMMWAFGDVPELNASWYDNQWPASTYFAVTKQPTS